MAWRLQFDGVDDYARIPNSVGDALKESFTLVGCIWVPDWSATPGPTLISHGYGWSGGRKYGVMIRAVHDGIAVLRNIGTTTEYWSGIFHDLASIEGWFWVSVTYNRLTGGLVGYIGDEAIGSAITTTGAVAFLNPRGYDVGTYSTYFSKFQLRHWSLWKGVCTQSEIAEIINKRYDQVSVPPAAIYEIDTGTGSVLVDSSGNGHHGTIHGATWVWESGAGEVLLSASLRGSSSATAKADRVRGLSAHLTGAATATGGEPIRIRGLSANLVGAGTTNVRMNLIAALKAHLQGKAALKSNMLVLFIPDGVYVIDADEIFAKDQPSRGQVVANHIEVWVNPLKPADTPEEVYRSKDPVTIPAGKTETVTIHFDDEPVTEPEATLEEAGANLSIVDTKYYAWGADVKIRNTGSGAQTCIIVATGKPLKVQGREVIVKRDEVSIQENGLKKYTFDNPFVQDRATAELIADKLLSFANAKRDIVIEWRGDPALELADVTMIPEYQRRDIDQRGIFYVTKQELEFDGGLRARLEGRKVE